MSKILITGAAGFIGSNLCHFLLKHTNYNIIGIDNMSVGSNWLNLPPIDNESRFQFSQVDINRPDQLEKIFISVYPNIVVHLAASSHVDRSLENDEFFWKTNVFGTRNVLLACKKYNTLKIINQCSDEVMGPILHSQRPAQEGDPFRPTSPYACSKAAQYYMGRSMINCYNLPIIHTFPCNVFGPRQWPEKLIPKFLINLFEGKKVPLMKNVKAEREWMYIDDHCSALLYLIQHGGDGEDYNISSNFHIANDTLTRKLLDFTGRDESFIEIVPDRTTHDCRYAINGNKLGKLGWSRIPSMEDFDEYLRETTDWYRENYRAFYKSFIKG